MSPRETIDVASSATHGAESAMGATPGEYRLLGIILASGMPRRSSSYPLPLPLPKDLHSRTTLLFRDATTGSGPRLRPQEPAQDPGIPYERLARDDRAHLRRAPEARGIGPASLRIERCDDAPDPR